MRTTRVGANRSESVHVQIKNVRDLLTESERNYITFVLGVIVCGIISVLGIITNIINMIIFYKQGLATTINISFFALAVSDLGCMVFQQLCCLYSNPLFVNLDFPIVYHEFQYFTTGITREIFARITCLITVYITAERCFCIAFPLHVKQIITPVRTATIMICIYAVVFLSNAPLYSTMYIDWKFYSIFNRTLLGLVYGGNKDDIEGPCNSFQATFIFVEFITVVLLTAVLIYKLERKSTWLKTAHCDMAKADRMANRDSKTMFMIILIASMLIICYLPCVVLLSAAIFEPAFSMGNIYTNIYIALWAVALFFEDINSSVNIFFYYKMSTHYRMTFRKCILKSYNRSKTEYLYSKKCGVVVRNRL